MFDIDLVQIIIDILHEDKYDDIDYLGEGAYGLVFKAFNNNILRKVAIKILKADPSVES